MRIYPIKPITTIHYMNTIECPHCYDELSFQRVSTPFHNLSYISCKENGKSISHEDNWFECECPNCGKDLFIKSDDLFLEVYKKDEVED